jgi:uncharacterized protein YgiM (DUF1202 family)
VAVGVLLAAAVFGFYFTFLSVFRGGPQRANTPVQQAVSQAEVSGKPAESGQQEKRPEKGPESQVTLTQKTQPFPGGGRQSMVVPPGETQPEASEAVVSVDRANVRERPGIDAPVVGAVDKGVRVRIEGEKVDQNGGKWFKVVLQGRREGWMSDRVLVVLRAGEVVIRDRRDML